MNNVLSTLKERLIKAGFEVNDRIADPAKPDALLVPTVYNTDTWDKIKGCIAGLPVNHSVESMPQGGWNIVFTVMAVADNHDYGKITITLDNKLDVLTLVTALRNLELDHIGDTSGIAQQQIKKVYDSIIKQLGYDPLPPHLRSQPAVWTPVKYSDDSLNSLNQ